MTLNEVFTALSGGDVSGEDFDSVEFEGKTWTIQYTKERVIDDQGKSYNKNAPQVRDVWAYWKENYDTSDEQVIETKRHGGLIHGVYPKHMRNGGLVAY